MSNVGENIKNARLKKKWTQEELAARMGYKSKSTINKIELGINDIPQSKIAQFADVLGLTPAALMGWDRPPEDLGALAARVLKDPALRQLVSDYLELTADDQALICRTAASLNTKKD